MIDSQPLALGFSSCPNDTFMFHGWVHGLVSGPAVQPVIEDVETLNARALDPQRRLAVTKLSVGVLPECLDDYCVLQVGAALGRGCGPIVVRRPERDDLASLADLAGLPVAIPGLHTTAWRLLQAFGPALHPVPMSFERVMAAVAAGEVAAGLVIHEGRFTFAKAGLAAMVDLGELWEQATGLPVPLGVIAALRTLGRERIVELEAALARSLGLAWSSPALSLPWIRQHAQELDDAVVRQHIELYVNDFSRELGEEGRGAVATLLGRCGVGEETSPWL